MYIDLSFDRSTSDRMERCSYVFVPIEEGENPRKNCKQVLAPFSPKTLPGESSKFAAHSAQSAKARKPGKETTPSEGESATATAVSPKEL